MFAQQNARITHLFEKFRQVPMQWIATHGDLVRTFGTACEYQHVRTLHLLTGLSSTCS